MDRIIGLYSIFTIASCTMLFSFSWEELKTHLSLVLPCYSCFCRSHTLFFFIFFNFSKLVLEKGRELKIGFLQKIFSTGELYQRHFHEFLLAFFYALVVQTLMLSFFVFLTSFFNDFSSSWRALLVVLPYWNGSYCCSFISRWAWSGACFF